MKESKKGLRPAKSADSSPSGGRAESEAGEQSTTSKGRRKFLGQLAGTAAAAAVSDLALSRKAQAGQKVAAAPNGTYAPLSESELMARRAVSFNGRLKHAAVWRDAAFELQLANDDELIYPEKFANCSRMLPHDGLGHPDLNAWDAFVTACHSGKPADFEAVPLGGTRPLRNPLSGMCLEALRLRLEPVDRCSRSGVRKRLEGRRGGRSLLGGPAARHTLRGLGDGPARRAGLRRSLGIERLSGPERGWPRHAEHDLPLPLSGRHAWTVALPVPAPGHPVWRTAHRPEAAGVHAR